MKYSLSTVWTHIVEFYYGYVKGYHNYDWFWGEYHKMAVSLFLILLKSLIFLVIEFFVAYHYHIEIAIRINLTYISKIAFL